MNVLILNGGPADGRGSVCRKIKGAVADEARSRRWAVAAFDLDGMSIKPCRGCFACWLRHPGICVIKDEQEEVLKAMVTSDLQVWITPVLFGGYGPALKRALDRSIPNILPFFTRIGGEVHHPQRYDRRRKFLAVGTLPAPDAESERIFHHLVRRNALNLGIVAAESSVVHEGEGQRRIDKRVKEWLVAIEGPR